MPAAHVTQQSLPINIVCLRSHSNFSRPQHANISGPSSAIYGYFNYLISDTEILTDRDLLHCKKHYSSVRMIAVVFLYVELEKAIKMIHLLSFGGNY